MDLCVFPASCRLPGNLVQVTIVYRRKRAWNMGKQSSGLTTGPLQPVCSAEPGAWRAEGLPLGKCVSV